MQFLIRVVLIVIAVVPTLTMAASASAQTAEEHKQHHPASAAPAPAPDTESSKAKPIEAPASMMAVDTRLNDLLQKMRAATGDAKIDAKVALPSPCFAPIVFVTSGGGSWFAVTGR